MLIRNDILPDTSMGQEWYQLKYKSFAPAGNFFAYINSYLQELLTVCRISKYCTAEAADQILQVSKNVADQN